MPVQRWEFFDHLIPETYVVPLNPRSMTSPFRERSIEAVGTTAVDGRDLLWERRSTPKQWEFSGAILNHDHYEALRHWVYDKTQRIRITDHFGREIWCILEVFEPTPKRSVGKYWRHEYRITGKVFNLGDATVFA